MAACGAKTDGADTRGDASPSVGYGCVKGASTRDLAAQSNERLWTLIGHYAWCKRDDQARAAILDELVRRDDPNALIQKAMGIYPSSPERAMALVRKADELGSPRTKPILDSYERGEDPPF